jgi:hypothetical protein
LDRFGRFRRNSIRFGRDVIAKRGPSDFAGQEMRRCAISLVVDALLAHPKLAGIGLDLAKPARFFSAKRDR